MSYTTYDFAESLKVVKIDPQAVETVIAAWGHGEGQGTDTGKGWSEDTVTEWRGGFLFRMKDGRIGYLQGWCDYTGWGCRDGAEVQWYDLVPQVADIRQPQPGDEPEYEPMTSDEPPPPVEWDESPADLNRWLQSGAKDPWSLE